MPRKTTRDPHYRCDCGCVHGTTRAYRHGCGCTPCRETNSAMRAAARRRVAYGHVTPLIDAGPAAERVREMRETMTIVGIARAAGVSKAVIQHLQRGTREKITQETHDRVMAVTAPVVLRGSLIDATGTRRRLQALVAAGWAPTILEAKLGKGSHDIYRLLCATHVTVTTAHTVRVLYDRLVDETPPGDTPTDRHRRSKALAHAARKGWARPDAWWQTSIDSPDTQPDTGAADEPGWVVAELDHLHGCGESADVAVTALGREPAALARMCHRYGRRDLATWVEAVRRAT